MSEQQQIDWMWRGVIRTEHRDEYVDYVERTSIEAYHLVPRS